MNIFELEQILVKLKTYASKVLIILKWMSSWFYYPKIDKTSSNRFDGK